MSTRLQIILASLIALMAGLGFVASQLALESESVVNQYAYEIQRLRREIVDQDSISQKKTDLIQEMGVTCTSETNGSSCKGPGELNLVLKGEEIKEKFESTTWTLTSTNASGTKRDVVFQNDTCIYGPCCDISYVLDEQGVKNSMRFAVISCRDGDAGAGKEVIYSVDLSDGSVIRQYECRLEGGMAFHNDVIVDEYQTKECKSHD